MIIELCLLIKRICLTDIQQKFIILSFIYSFSISPFYLPTSLFRFICQFHCPVLLHRFIVPFHLPGSYSPFHWSISFARFVAMFHRFVSFDLLYCPVWLPCFTVPFHLPVLLYYLCFICSGSLPRLICQIRCPVSSYRFICQICFPVWSLLFICQFHSPFHRFVSIASFIVPFHLPRFICSVSLLRFIYQFHSPLHCERAPRELRLVTERQKYKANLGVLPNWKNTSDQASKRLVHLGNRVYLIESPPETV